MKKCAIFTVFIVLLLCFAGCSTLPEESILTEEQESEQFHQESFTERDNIKPQTPEFDTPILIKSNDEYATPYVHMMWSETWGKHGWLAADGLSLYNVFPEIHTEIPEVLFAEDFQILYNDDVSFVRMQIYGEDFETLSFHFVSEDLKELVRGTYYLGMIVQKQGNYIQSEDKYEMHGYECVVRLIKEDAEIDTFSYTKDSAYYNTWQAASLKESDPGVKTDGFKNTQKAFILTAKHAAEHAKNECTVEYDTIKIAYDQDTETWKVSFFKENMLGGDQTVYFGKNGITKRIVYGE